MNGGYWTSTPTENTGESGFGVGGSAPGGATWAEIRALIAACEDLPEGVREQLLALGDKSDGGKVESAIDSPEGQPRF